MKHKVTHYFSSRTYVSFICCIELHLISICEVAKFSKQRRLWNKEGQGKQLSLMSLTVEQALPPGLCPLGQIY